MHTALLIAISLLPAPAALALAIAWKRRAAATPHAPVARTAALNPPASSHGWLLGLLAATLPLAATAILLKLRWQTIPQRFPIHWGIGGKPDAWTTRTPGSVFGLLFVAALIIGGFALLGQIIARSSPGHEGRAANVSISRTVLLASAWFIAILFCGISLLPLAHDPTNLIPLIVVGCSLFSLTLIGYIAYRTMKFAAAITAAQNSTDARYWKAGLISYNPADSALMVPKREGFGYTMNFARPTAWLIFGAILFIPVVIPILIHTSRR